MGTTVIHGIDQSVPDFRNLPAKGHPGTIVHQEDFMCSWIYDIENLVYSPFEYICFEYDVSKDGGELGFHNLDVELPANTLVWDGMYQVGIALVSVGDRTTIEMKLEEPAGGNGDLLARVLIATAGTIGLHDIRPNGTAALSIRCTAARQLKIEIRGAALTAGVLRGFIRCFRSFSGEDVSMSRSSSASDSSSGISTGSSGEPSSSSSTQASSFSTSSSSSSISSSISDETTYTPPD